MPEDRKVLPLPDVASEAAIEEIVARYYDYEHDALTADVALYVELARQAPGPVLELGCGTGRVLAALARAGLTAVGIDPSRAMLARARARLAAAPPNAAPGRLIAGDVRALDLDDRFALVLAPLDFLGYFPAVEEQRRVLAAARRHLLPHGRLAIDLPFPPGAFLDQPRGVLVHQWTRREPDGGQVSKWWVREVDVAAQVQYLTAYYDLVAPDGVLRRWVHELPLRYYYRYELEALVAGAGFTVEAVYGDYALGELASDSARLLLLARRDES